ncbi:MAG TPA: aromatic amino acid lyase, partial [Thermomicrobiaceae bacterium]|nr:aromatic amino acid lyase [Thermomicrobiaceae bacterium]
ALPLDYLKAAVASLGSLTERRIALLVDSHMSGLPAFLVPTAGTNSGFMIAQYTAAALASENKILAHPASVDSIPTSANMEDYNSMGTIAARTLTSVIENTRAIIAIELICAAQAIDLRGGPIWGEGVAAAFRKVRETIPFIEHDECIMSDLIAEATRLIASGELQEAVDPVVSRYIPANGHADHAEMEGDAS